MMYVDETNIWYISGFPVSFPMILEWWERYCYKTPKEKRYIGDPRFSDKVCKQIASIIVQEMTKKVSGASIFGSPYTNTGEIKSHTNNKVSLHKSIGEDPETKGMNWHDQDAVLKAALYTAERQYKERQAADKKAQQERADFWKTNKKQYVPPVPIPVPVLNWKAVLGIKINDIITEELIKNLYRKQAMIRHPDRGGTDKLMYELFKARDDAYNYLGKAVP